jgi:hypothetical protein
MILVDTGPFVALCDRRDTHHRRAVKHLAKFGRQPFATCEAVITEACFHLASAAARARLHALLTELDVTVLGVGTAAAERDLAFDWLGRYAEHQPDWADACLVVLSDRDASTRIWTYDREFRTTWRRPNGARMRLAVED